MSQSVVPFARALPARPAAPPVLDLESLEATATRLAGSAVWGTFQPLTANERTYAMIAANETYEAWVISWPVGCAIALHDHGRSYGAVRVLRGALVERSTNRSRSEGLGCRTLEEGEVVSFGPDHLHEIANSSDRLALSIHVYSPPLATMTYYNDAMPSSRP